MKRGSKDKWVGIREVKIGEEMVEWEIEDKYMRKRGKNGRVWNNGGKNGRVW